MLGIVGSRPIQWLNAWTNFLVKLTFTKGVQSRTLTKKELVQYYRLFNNPQKRRRITALLYSLRQNQSFMESVKSAFEQQLKTIPALLIYGEDDPVTQLGIPQRIHDLLDHSALYFIKNEGHFPHEGQAEQMCSIILGWLESIKLQQLERGTFARKSA